MLQVRRSNNQIENSNLCKVSLVQGPGVGLECSVSSNINFGYQSVFKGSRVNGHLDKPLQIIGAYSLKEAGPRGNVLILFYNRPTAGVTV